MLFPPVYLLHVPLGFMVLNMRNAPFSKIKAPEPAVSCCGLMLWCDYSTGRLVCQQAGNGCWQPEWEKEIIWAGRLLDCLEGLAPPKQFTAVQKPSCLRSAYHSGTKTAMFKAGHCSSPWTHAMMIALNSRDTAPGYGILKREAPSFSENRTLLFTPKPW